MTNCIFTFGYEGLSIREFIGRLQGAGIQTVVDVRAKVSVLFHSCDA
jgi:hypothetical protein